MKEESTVARNLVRDHQETNNIKIETLDVSNKLIISCNTAHSRYKATSGEKAEKAKKLVENEKRELSLAELSGLINKQNNLISTCNFLHDEFTRYVA